MTTEDRRSYDFVKQKIYWKPEMKKETQTRKMTGKKVLRLWATIITNVEVSLSLKLGIYEYKLVVLNTYLHVKAGH